MESTIPVVRFVKCPKCFKILTEFAEVPVYKCGGCGAILRAKTHSSNEQKSSTVYTNSASENLTVIDPVSKEPVNLQGRTNLNVSESSCEDISMEKSQEHDRSRVNNIPDSEDSEDLEQPLKVNPEADDSLKSTDKLKESSETMEHSTTSEEDFIKTEFANRIHFRMNTISSSHAYDGSASSTDEDMKDHIPRKYLLSRRTHGNKHVSDSLCTRASFGSSNSPTKFARVKIDYKSSEQEDQMKILSKVDDLRNELRGLFNEKSNVEGFKAKVSSTMENTTINHGPQDLQHKALKSRSMVRLCRPLSGGAPFVICYKCFRLLQLPSDFLVSPKKVHKLRCGACLEVLLFSFRPRSCLVPRTPGEFRHPPSEENGSLITRIEEDNGWDPISTSEDSYLSLAKSNSSEVEPSMNTSRSSDGIVEQEQGVDRSVIGSRLHNLLGYSTPKQMLFNTDYSNDGHESTDSDTRSFYRPYGRRRWERH